MLDIPKKLVVAISSRALFDLEDSHRVYTEQGVQAYCDYQIKHENQNSADTGLRVFNSIQHHQLPITRAAFTGGQSPFEYVEPFGADLFLSSDPNDVAETLDSGFAAATILPSNAGEKESSTQNSQLKIAFDGDAVLFSDEAERVYKKEGLEAFTESESLAANDPLPGGPFKNLLAALQMLQNEFDSKQLPIRTALVTARAAPAHERVIKTLRHWNIRIDEALFLGGMNKGEFLRKFGADIFFDDQKGHCESARHFQFIVVRNSIVAFL